MKLLDCKYCKCQPTLYKKGVLLKKGKVKYSYYYQCFRCGRKTPLRYRSIADAQIVWNRCVESDSFDYHYHDYFETNSVNLGSSKDHKILGDE